MMKVLSILCCLFFSTSLFAKSIVVTGLRAKALMAIGDATENTDATLGGKTYMYIHHIRCLKTVDEKKEIYFEACSFKGMKDTIVRSDAEENRYTAEELRTALIDTLNNEVRLSPTKKSISVNSIDCEGKGVQHSLDSIDSEQFFRCKLVY